MKMWICDPTFISVYCPEIGIFFVNIIFIVSYLQK